MTEAQWLACRNPRDMVNFMRGKVDGKLQLFFCACCRDIWHLLNAPLFRQAVELAEQFADGLADERRVQIIWRQLHAGLYATSANTAASAVSGAVSGAYPVWALDEVANLVCDDLAAQAMAR